jgi:predicted transposase YdaD
MASMKEEYNLEEAKQNKYLAGVEEGLKKRELAIAKTMLKEGLEADLIHKITGVSLSVLQTIIN